MPLPKARPNCEPCRERLKQLPDASNITIAYPDEGAWKRFHYQFGDYPEVGGWVLFMVRVGGWCCGFDVWCLAVGC